MPVPADFVIEHADLIATCAGPAPRRGLGQRDISPLRDGVVAAFDGRIVYVGPAAALDGVVDVQAGATRIDARGCTVVPGFVDPHTHVVYAGDRVSDIMQTVAATRAATDEQLVSAARVRLDEMLNCGTTLCEAKSGYGLDVDTELRQLHAIRTLNEEHAIDIVSTFMGAHEIPVDYASRRREYIDLVTTEMLPRVADGWLAEYCDVLCEEGVFTVDESTEILEAASAAGLVPRVHADQLRPSGGASVAAHVRARSADHLVWTDERSADALADAEVCATLLPIAAFYLKLGRFAPARMLIERGVAVALATDVNAGAGCSPSMPFAMTLACVSMHMTLQEALIAATLNAAWSLDRAHDAGSLETGKLMDAAIVKGGLSELLRVGAPAIRMVVKRGKVVSWAST